MSTNLGRHRDDLRRLTELGQLIETDLGLRAVGESKSTRKEQNELAEKVFGTFEKHYQRWYTESLVLIRQLVPDRLNEFEALYRGDGRRKYISFATYSIQDWLIGVRAPGDCGLKVFSDISAVSMRVSTQLRILEAVEARFESSLFDIRQWVTADLFDSELDGARDLLKHGFLRAAGVVAGVVIEKHLRQVCGNRHVTVRKKHPAIGDLNDALKEVGVVDVPTWRFIQRLADLRNLCGHERQREPTKEEVAELIDGAEKTSKTLC